MWPLIMQPVINLHHRIRFNVDRGISVLTCVNQFQIVPFHFPSTNPINKDRNRMNFFFHFIFVNSIFQEREILRNISTLQHFEISYLWSFCSSFDWFMQFFWGFLSTWIFVLSLFIRGKIFVKAFFSLSFHFQFTLESGIKACFRFVFW